MKVIKAPVTVRAAIHAIIVGQMAAALIQTRAQLSNPDACRSCLLDAGFGEPSITRLMSRAIAAATDSLKSQENRT